MTEQQLEDDLQRTNNIEIIRRAVEKVSKQREVECRNEIDFDNLGFDNNFDGDAH